MATRTTSRIRALPGPTQATRPCEPSAGPEASSPGPDAALAATVTACGEAIASWWQAERVLVRGLTGDDPIEVWAAFGAAAAEVPDARRRATRALEQLVVRIFDGSGIPPHLREHAWTMLTATRGLELED